MRVDGRVAVAGKVLCARGDADALRACDEGGDVPRDEVRLGTEGADADDRVPRIRVDVRNRGEVHRHADPRQLRGNRGRDALGQLSVVDGAQREVARVGAAARSLQARDVAALLVDRDDQLVTLGPQRSGERCGLRAVSDVVRKQHDPAESAAEPGSNPVRGLRPGEARKDAGRRLALELDGHPRTAPAVRPKAIRRCTATKNTTTGIAVNVAPAISGPHWVPRRLVNCASQTVKVWFSGLLSTM